MSNLRHNFTVSFSTDDFDVKRVHQFMSRTDWAKNRSLETVAKSIANSLCCGVFLEGCLVAFSRVVTDHCTFAYLCDVFVDEDFRGQRLSKLMLENIMAHHELKGLRRFVLATKDAHVLYEKYGFTRLGPDEQSRFMSIRNDSV